jgi:hypothetical protein
VVRLKPNDPAGTYQVAVTARFNAATALATTTFVVQ